MIIRKIENYVTLVQKFQEKLMSLSDIAQLTGVAEEALRAVLDERRDFTAVEQRQLWTLYYYSRLNPDSD